MDTVAVRPVDHSRPQVLTQTSMKNLWRKATESALSRIKDRSVELFHELQSSDQVRLTFRRAGVRVQCYSGQSPVI